MQLVFVSIPTYLRRVASPDAPLRRARRAGEALLFRQAGLYVDSLASRSLCRGLWALASACRRAGHEVTWIDAGDGLLSSPATQDRLARALATADQLWLYAMTPTFDDCLQLARTAKRCNPRLTVLMGGPHASACFPRILAEHPEISLVSTGFQPSDHLAATLSSLPDMPATAHLDPRGQLYCTPGPAEPHYREVVDPTLLERPIHEYHINISSTVGCSFSCNFCVDGEQPLRTRDLEDVMAELRDYDRRLPAGTVVHFFDTVFGLPRPHFARLAEFMATEIRSLQFSCDVKANAVTDELAQKLQRARVRFVSMGVETSAASVLQITRKQQDYSGCIAAAKTLRRQMPTAVIKGYWILGLPGTTPATAQQDLTAAQELLRSGTFDILSPKFFVPYPGTSYFTSPQAHGLALRTRDFREYDRFHTPPVCHPKALSSEALVQLLATYEGFLAQHYAQRLGTSVAALQTDALQNPRYNGPLYDVGDAAVPASGAA